MVVQDVPARVAGHRQGEAVEGVFREDALDEDLRLLDDAVVEGLPALAHPEGVEIGKQAQIDRIPGLVVRVRQHRAHGAERRDVELEDGVEGVERRARGQARPARLLQRQADPVDRLVHEARHGPVLEAEVLVAGELGRPAPQELLAGRLVDQERQEELVAVLVDLGLQAAPAAPDP